MKQVAVIIPVYKPKPNDFEIISLKQVIKILYKYDFKIVTYKELDTAIYDQYLQEGKINYKYEYFDPIFFKDLQGYNKLMLSKDFYKRFTDYKFILIYQLDAYVFRDELEYWCEQDYDFIGAPLMEIEKGSDKKFFIKSGNNGGFSLRKIDYCIKFLNYKGPLLKPSSIYKILKERYNQNKLRLFYVFFNRIIGHKNNINYFIHKINLNEDLVFCLTFSIPVAWINVQLNEYKTWIKPNLPDSSISINFSFEHFPAYLYSINNKLPFGCHAWKDHEFSIFWITYIK